jgi:hypothetical protein
MKKLLLLTLAALPLFAAAQVPSYVPTNGLVGWWPFNGNANDESGNGNNGNNIVGNFTTDRNSIANSSFYGDGNGSGINISALNNFPFGNSNRTISTWFKCDMPYPGGDRTLFTYGDNTFGTRFSIYLTGSSIGVEYMNGSVLSVFVPDQLWHNIVATYNGNGSNGILLYLDGVLLSTNIVGPTSSLNTANSFIHNIGNLNNIYNFSGKYDDIGIWNRVLTPCEIQALYNSGTGPTAAVSAASAICLGDTTALNASGASTYLWMPGNLIGSSVNVTPNATTTYTVTGTDVNGCVSSDTVSVTINSLPVVAAVSTVGSICEGQSDTLLASGAQSYLWSTGGFAAQEVVAPLTTTTYSLTGTDINGCSNTATVTVNVNLLPSIAATASSDTVCLGLSTTLTALGASSYIWSSGGTAATEIVTPAASTTYTVYGTDINGCMDTATISVTVNSLPAVSAASSAATFCEADANGALVGLPAQGTWSGPGVTGNSFNPATAGAGTHNVVYTYTDNNGCSNSDTLILIVDACTGITEEKKASFTVFPNPATNNIAVTWATPHVNTLTLRDATGRDVRTYSVSGTQAQLSLEGLASGVYFLSVGGETKSVQTIIKQ